jgi:hypothetical protein
MKKKNPIVKKSKKYIPIRFIQKRKKFSSFFFSFTSVNLIWFIYLFIFGWSDDEGGRKVGISLNVCETKQTNMCACIHIKVSFLLSLLLFYLFFFCFFLVSWIYDFPPRRALILLQSFKNMNCCWLLLSVKGNPLDRWFFSWAMDPRRASPLLSTLLFGC